MLPTLQIGPLALPVPQLSLLLSIWLGITLAEKWAPKFNISIEALYGLVFTGLIAGVIGARVTYVFQYPGAFIQSPLSLVSLSSELLNPLGGFVFGALGAIIYGQRAGLSFWNALDALTPVLAVTATGLAAAHFASGESFGSPANLPWSVYLWGARRHPSQVYEFFSALIILGLLFRWLRTCPRPGTFFLIFSALSAAARLFLETFRGDSATTLGGLRVVQIYAWIVLALVFFLFEFRNHQVVEKG